MSDIPVDAIRVPSLCAKHHSLLVHGCAYSRSDPWQALCIVANIALWQAATCDEETWKKIETPQEVGKLGCLACYKPGAFGEIVEAGKTHDLGAIKSLGEKWIAEAAKAKPTVQ